MRILITGASSGIGRELAKLYATKDNELILLARREDRLQELQSQLLKAKSVEIVVADVGEFDTLQEKIRDMGAVDMVILNAGISLGHSLEMTPFKDFKKLYDVNLLSNHAILEILLPHFKSQGSGKIVFISSLASLFSMPSSKAYSSSKRALNAYAEGIRYKCKPYGIKVINILPGFIKSELTDKNSFHMPFLLSTEDGAKIIKRAIDKNKKFYPFPKRFYFFILLFRLFPDFIKQKIIKSAL
ncbi:SDR family NAD(P)-dependent oxidoreductase [Sulfurimonas sp. RIFOXYB12_FULL_35_9]|uniref:SDR family NAD(P)-dependent oxidoreductase n=2 Tax=unclassified Sulfurimonas TaxID=2623549 RepID=UPI0008CDBAE6|nr:SDR family NAD(P)-dependent oxidoreductase [Sulfurimonas sp. RIFOXYB12_FULL_35_9]MBS4067371.1 SDR family NAD(P)-dependent oxidoreductase [Sulfurimonas sp.]MDX9756170.1 SDR family NAD(P)-dependent oxidoreductase [Sulfurimonas sp.]OHE03735.1 MAG: short-chain dehydrogenase [Sulfurimonas sp. RIFOXYB12_FULL_35_9]